MSVVPVTPQRVTPGAALAVQSPRVHALRPGIFSNKCHPPFPASGSPLDIIRAAAVKGPAVTGQLMLPGTSRCTRGQGADTPVVLKVCPTLLSRFLPTPGTCVIVVGPI